MLTWTDEIPTVTGQYWKRPRGEKAVDIVDVVVGSPDDMWRNGLTVWVYENDMYDPLNDPESYQWAGPIPEPREP